MALRNPDGTPYKAIGSLQQFDPENPEHKLFNLWDEEIISIGGSPIFYYEVMIQFQSMDKLYMEDRSKLFATDPIKLYATYEPIPSQNNMGAFGIDGTDEMIFQMNYNAVLKQLGHAPKLGSRIYSPHLRENWVIIQRNLGEFKLWGGIRLDVMAKKFQESSTTGEGKISQGKNIPDFKIL